METETSNVSCHWCTLSLEASNFNHDVWTISNLLFLDELISVVCELQGILQEVVYLDFFNPALGLTGTETALVMT